MCPEGPERKLAAILSADVVGYSRLMAEDEDSTLRTLAAYREEVGLLVRQHRGRVVDFTGDNFLAEFPSALEAVRCALEIQSVLRARNAHLPSNRRMEFRIGAHLGDVRVEHDSIFGDGVNIAARLEGLAEPGGICISGTVHEQVERKLALGFEDLGEQALKNIPKPVRVFRVRTERPEVAVGENLPGMKELTVPGFSGRPAIAVLPFDNLSGDPEQEYFADGLAEALITRLSAYGSFPVIARNSSFRYKGQAVNVQQVGHELGARYVVEGSVQRAGDRVRISVQLIDATTAHHVWAEAYDRELNDIFAVQDEITESIVGSVVPKLRRSEFDRAARREPGNPDAYDLVMRGWWHFRRKTKYDNVNARACFEKAIELDPVNAEAWFALAHSHYMDVHWLFSTSPSHSIAEVQRAARKAVSLNPQDAWAHFALAEAYQLTGHREEMIAAARRSIELNPNFALAHGLLGIYLAYAGSPEDAIPHIEKAMRLNPRDPDMPMFMHGVAAAHFAAGRYGEAVDWAKRSLRALPDYQWSLAFLAASQAHLGRVDEARTALEDLLRAQPEFDPAYVRRFVPYADPDFLERLIDGLRKAGLPEE